MEVRENHAIRSPAGIPRFVAYSPRENKLGELIIVVQASRLRSPCLQAGRLHHNWQSHSCAVPYQLPSPASLDQEPSAVAGSPELGAGIGGLITGAGGGAEAPWLI